MAPTEPGRPADGRRRPRDFTYAVNGDGTVLTVSQFQDGVNVSVLQVVLTDRMSGNYTSPSYMRSIMRRGRTKTIRPYVQL